MDGIVDFHSHILPDMDDGSASVEESLALLRMEAEQGIRRVVATPHFYARYDSPLKFLERREQSEAALRAEMAKHPGLPEVRVGAEVYFFRGMCESEWLPQLTISGTRCMLLEMPPAPWPDDFYREVAGIYERQGIVPVIAHVERYISLLSYRGVLRKLEQLPVLIQANGEFFLSKGTSSMAMRMLKADRIHLLGSDCHNLTGRSPNLAQAAEGIREKLGQEALDRISWYQQRILNAETVFPF